MPASVAPCAAAMHVRAGALSAAVLFARESGCTCEHPLPMSTAQRVLVIDAGRTGNSARLLDRACEWLAGAEIERIALAERPSFEAHRDRIERANAYVIATGTYWDSWSS